MQAVSEIMGDDNMEVIIQKHRENKTVEQRGFWHFLLKIIGDETGYTLIEVKELIKKQLLGTKEIKIGGVVREVTESSESQTRMDYSKLIEETYRLAAEAGIQLPNPKYNG